MILEENDTMFFYHYNIIIMPFVKLESKYVINNMVIVTREANIENALSCPSLCKPSRITVDIMREILGRMIVRDTEQIRYASRNCSHRWLVVGDNEEKWCLTMSLHRVITLYNSAETQAYDFIFPQAVGEYDDDFTLRSHRPRKELFSSQWNISKL